MNIRLFTFIVISAVCFTRAISASVYINKIINNTNQRIALEYAVPVCNITPISAIHSTKGLHHGIAALNAGVAINPCLKSTWNVHLDNGISFSLNGAYIPKALSLLDTHNVLTLKTGSLSGLNNDSVFASIRICDGYLEKIYPDKPKAAIRIIEEKLIEGSNYTLEIRQVSDELYYTDRFGKPIVNLDAFEIIFSKN